MHAIVQDRYGSTDTLHLSDTERPTPDDTEVLVRVASAGVDRGVWHLMTGLPRVIRLGFGLRKPRNPVLGMDLAGVVEGVGNDVTRFAEGDRVFGIGKGTFAEFARASQDKLAAVPGNVELADAGALAISGSTALQAVEDHGRVSPGQEVLVLGASGGVGSYAVQIATALGATVTGVASADKHDLVRELGARHVIDYRSADPLCGSQRYDLIIDTGGRRSLRHLRRALTPEGTLVIVGGEGGGPWLGGFDRQLRAKLMSPFIRQQLKMFVASEDGAHLERLADLVESGLVRPAVGARFPLPQTPAAIDHLEAGGARGKILVEVQDVA